MSHSGLLSRRYAPPLPEVDAPVHAILRPALQESGAAARREALLAQLDETPLPEGLVLLDGLLDLLQARMRVDPRPRPTTRNHPRPQGIAPPPVPTSESTKTAAPPPPLPFAHLTSEPPQLPGMGAPPADEQGAPPVLPTSQHARPTTQKRAGTLPIQSPTAVQGPLLAPHITDQSLSAHLLMDDAQGLSLLHDREGMLISFERLIVLSQLEGQIRSMADKNGARMLSFHEAELKGFKRTPKFRPPTVENTMPRAYLRAEKIAKVLPLIDGRRTIDAIIKDAAPLEPLETTSVLCQLKRAGVIEI